MLCQTILSRNIKLLVLCAVKYNEGIAFSKLTATIFKYMCVSFANIFLRLSIVAVNKSMKRIYNCVN